MARALSGGSSFPVANGSPTQTDPAVCGSLAVWTDTGNNSDVSAKQLPNGNPIAVATSPAVDSPLLRPDGTPADQREPSLVGRTVVFQSDAPGPWNVYGVQLFFFTRGGAPEPARQSGRT